MLEQPPNQEQLDRLLKRLDGIIRRIDSSNEGERTNALKLALKAMEEISILTDKPFNFGTILNSVGAQTPPDVTALQEQLNQALQANAGFVTSERILRERLETTALELQTTQHQLRKANDDFSKLSEEYDYLNQKHTNFERDFLRAAKNAPAGTSPFTPNSQAAINAGNIYLGVYDPLQDKSLRFDWTYRGPLFDVYAAPKDLQDYEDHRLVENQTTMIAAAAAARQWYGYDGSTEITSKELLNNTIPSQDFNQLSKWFLPTDYIFQELLFPQIGKSLLKKEFASASGLTGIAGYMPNCYLTLNGVGIALPGNNKISLRPEHRVSARLIRLEPR